MIIECFECGAKNQLLQSPQPGKRYRCGNCGAPIVFLESVDAQGQTTLVPTVSTGYEEPPKNTSGQGSLAMIPEEIRGWNWGAFLLNWIWGIGNNVWIALLAFIPYIGFVMAIVLGVKGNEWAWRYKKWDSVEHFKRTQRTWAIWGAVLCIVPFAIMFLAVTFVVIIPNIGAFIGAGEREAAEMELLTVQTAVHALMVDNEVPTLPNPIDYAGGTATNDMAAFPDSTTTAADKGYTGVGTPKAGYVLHAHDLIGIDTTTFQTVDYVTMTKAAYYYTCESDGTVRQFDSYNIATATEYTYY